MRSTTETITGPAMAALCLYEAMLDARDKNPALDEVWGNYGSFEMRDRAIAMAPKIEDVWEAVEAAHGEIDGAICYDFEFCPMMVDHIDFTDGSWNKPEAEIVAAVAVVLLAERKRNWLACAKMHCERLWAYPQLIEDHAERFENARTDGKSPDEAAREIGERYDLIPVTEWKRGF